MKKIRMKEGKELLRSLAVGEDTLISSLEVPEDVVQAVEEALVIVGCDVEALYPSMDR